MSQAGGQAPVTAYSVLRFAVVVFYVVMAVWLIASAARRVYLISEGLSTPDPAPFASFGIGVAGLLLLAAVVIVRLVTTRRHQGGTDARVR